MIIICSYRTIWCYSCLWRYTNICTQNNFGADLHNSQESKSPLKKLKLTLGYGKPQFPSSPLPRIVNSTEQTIDIFKQFWTRGGGKVRNPYESPTIWTFTWHKGYKEQSWINQLLFSKEHLALTEARGVLNFWKFSKNFSLVNVLTIWHSEPNILIKKVFTRVSFPCAIPCTLNCVSFLPLTFISAEQQSLCLVFTVQVLALLEEEPLWKYYSLCIFLSMPILLCMLPFPSQSNSQQSSTAGGWSGHGHGY